MWPFNKTPEARPARRTPHTHTRRQVSQAVAPSQVNAGAVSRHPGDEGEFSPVPFRPEADDLQGAGLGSLNNNTAIELEHISTFARVPKFQRVLSDGDRPVVDLNKADKDRVVVVEMTGRSALIVHAQVDQSLLDSIKGTLRAGKYSLRVASAEASVIKDIYSASSKTDLNSSGPRKRNEFMAGIGEWIEYGVHNRATDIHLECSGSSGVVRFRVDGEVEQMRAGHEGVYSAQYLEDCMATLFNNDQQAKSGSNALFDRDQFLYCMVPYSEIPNHALKLRYQSLKGNDGPKVVLRLLHVDENLPTQTFQELGYSKSQVALLNQAMDTPSGMVNMAGVTGSGKSTTLKSFIELNPHTPNSNVLTIEDPVEYPIRGAHQVPVQRDLSNPEESARRFTETITAFLRADPDIVMVGEIRDRFSANAAQQLSETGHMSLGTVHAHLLSGIVPRLVNSEIGMTRQTLTAPNMLTLLAYQALVPRLCPHCSLKSEEASSDWRISSISENVKKLKLDAGLLRWKRIGGCKECNGRGTLGLTVVAEMLMPDEEWLKPIRDGNDTEAVRVYRSRSNRNLMDEDMTGKSVFEHTLYKSLHGQVDARQCSAFDTWHRFMQYHGVK